MPKFLSLLILFLSSLYAERFYIPNVPVYERDDYRYFLTDLSAWEKLSSFPDYSGKFQLLPVNQSDYLILFESSLFKTISKIISLRPAKKNLPFVLWDISYRSRVAKRNFSLSDLKSGYKDVVLNEKYLREIAVAYPQLAHFQVLGKTAQNRNIPALCLCVRNETGPKGSILFTGAHHGNELLPTESVFDILYMVLSNTEKYRDVLSHTDIWFVPIVNPDGSAFFWQREMRGGRKNGSVYAGQRPNTYNSGVDLNRNYPFKFNTGKYKASSSYVNSQVYRGPAAASEPEVRAMIELANQNHFSGSISFHSQAGALLVPYTVNETRNPYPAHLFTLANKMLADINSFHITRAYKPRKHLYPVDGTDQDYYYNTFGTVAYIIENSHHNLPYAETIVVTENLRPAVNIFLREVIFGPAIRLKITDDDGNALGARVSLHEIRYFEKEQFYAEKKSGRFFLSVPPAKKYTLTVSYPHYDPVQLEYNNLTETKYRHVELRHNTIK